jgi:hypothetical protein
MQKLLSRLTISILLLLIALQPAGLATGQGLQLPSECQELAFSTEEDFVTQGPVPPDGNPLISDGDLLAKGHNSAGALVCSVCARNRDLLMPFQVMQDLGLDAVDVLDVETNLAAFSTELDSSNAGQFTAGDLLFTNGAILPNQSLLQLFGVPFDAGLDSVQLIGEMDSILMFAAEIAKFPRAYWIEAPGALAQLFERYQVDIWFSTEATFSPATHPGFLDGDLLSAATGTIVIPNKDLLPLSVPAGITERGVDFGLDAFASSRELDSRLMYFSTEILYQMGPPSFTDGDVLLTGNGVGIPHPDLLNCFEPAADFLGLDALSMNIPPMWIFVPFAIR